MESWRWLCVLVMYCKCMYCTQCLIHSQYGVQILTLVGELQCRHKQGRHRHITHAEQTTGHQTKALGKCLQVAFQFGKKQNKTKKISLPGVFKRLFTTEHKKSPHPERTAVDIGSLPFPLSQLEPLTWALPLGVVRELGRLQRPNDQWG